MILKCGARQMGQTKQSVGFAHSTRRYYHVGAVQAELEVLRRKTAKTIGRRQRPKVLAYDSPGHSRIRKLSREETDRRMVWAVNKYSRAVTCRRESESNTAKPSLVDIMAPNPGLLDTSNSTAQRAAERASSSDSCAQLYTSIPQPERTPLLFPNSSCKHSLGKWQSGLTLRVDLDFVSKACAGMKFQEALSGHHTLACAPSKS